MHERERESKNKIQFRILFDDIGSNLSTWVLRKVFFLMPLFKKYNQDFRTEPISAVLMLWNLLNHKNERKYFFEEMYFGQQLLLTHLFKGI